MPRASEKGLLCMVSHFVPSKVFLGTERFLIHDVSFLSLVCGYALGLFCERGNVFQLQRVCFIHMCL